MNFQHESTGRKLIAFNDLIPPVSHSPYTLTKTRLPDTKGLKLQQINQKNDDLTVPIVNEIREIVQYREREPFIFTVDFHQSHANKIQ